MSFFSSIEHFFGKLFTKAPTVLQTASGVLTITAPLIGEIYTIATGDPTDAVEVQNIVAEVQADMATASTLISQSHAAPSTSTYQQLSTLFNSVNNNLDALLSAGHIKNPETVAKVKVLIGTVTGEMNAVLALLPPPVTATPTQSTATILDSAAAPVTTPTAG